MLESRCCSTRVHWTSADSARGGFSRPYRLDSGEQDQSDRYKSFIYFTNQRKKEETK